MVSGIIIHIILLVFLVSLAAFFSAVEIALVSLTPTQIRRLIKEGTKRGKRLIFWEKETDRILITISIGNNLANIATSAIAVTIFIHAIPTISVDSAAAIATFVATLLVLIFAEITPKLLGKRHAVGISLVSLPFLSVLVRALNPVSNAVWAISRGLLRTIGREKREIHPSETHREEIRALLELVRKEGVFSERENRMLMSILHLGKTKVKDIMVNRMNMVCLELRTESATVLECVRKTGFSRIPVYEGSVDAIKGILMAKDILSYWNEKSFRLASLVRPAKYVPEMITIDHLLRDLINDRTHLAIVVNEYGEVEGLVTLEDVIEEITGEIQDEFDTESIMVKRA